MYLFSRAPLFEPHWTLVGGEPMRSAVLCRAIAAATIAVAVLTPIASPAQAAVSTKPSSGAVMSQRTVQERATALVASGDSGIAQTFQALSENQLAA